MNRVLKRKKIIILTTFRNQNVGLPKPKYFFEIPLILFIKETNMPCFNKNIFFAQIGSKNYTLSDTTKFF